MTSITTDSVSTHLNLSWEVPEWKECLFSFSVINTRPLFSLKSSSRADAAVSLRNSCDYLVTALAFEGEMQSCLICFINFRRDVIGFGAQDLGLAGSDGGSPWWGFPRCAVTALIEWEMLNVWWCSALFLVREWGESKQCSKQISLWVVPVVSHCLRTAGLRLQCWTWFSDARVVFQAGLIELCWIHTAYLNEVRFWQLLWGTLCKSVFLH